MKEEIPLKFLFFVLYSGLAWMRVSLLYCFFIQMPISSGNTLTDLCRNVLVTIWASLSLVKMAFKITHRNTWCAEPHCSNEYDPNLYLFIYLF